MAAYITTISNLCERESSATHISSTLLDENGEIKGKSAERHSHIWSAHAVSVMLYHFSSTSDHVCNMQLPWYRVSQWVILHCHLFWSCSYLDRFCRFLVQENIVLSLAVVIQMQTGHFFHCYSALGRVRFMLPKQQRQTTGQYIIDFLDALYEFVIFYLTYLFTNY